MAERICLACGEALTYFEANDPGSGGVCDACQAEIAFAGAARVRTQRARQLLSAETQACFPQVSSETRCPAGSSGSAR